MKLRNKKTGEIKAVNKGVALIHYSDGTTVGYNSLAELNEEWEDYEEPREYWFIGCDGSVEQDCQDSTESHIHKHKLVGNYFDTREEAEKGVKKLKAWKRLRKNGFRFSGWNGTQIGSNISYISEIYYEGCSDDMDLLFGGEE